MTAMNPAARALGPAVLALDYEHEADRIARWMPEVVGQQFRRRGVVVAMSGGIDSSLCAALAVRAFGPQRVLGLLMPERDSSAASADLGEQLARHLGIAFVKENIAPALEAIGCYRWRDEAIRSVFPTYGAGWKNKIIIAGGANGQMNYFKLVVQAPDGRTEEKRLPAKAYLQIVAATNFKQRIRKTLDYFHADRLNYAVVGTPNRLEYDQGFFVKSGDGAADIKPIAHLYKSQVYAMAIHLGLPAAITSVRPTTDTYSLPQGQDEFYFVLPYEQMDLALWAVNHGLPAAALAAALNVAPERAQFVMHDIAAKRAATRYLGAPPVLIEPVGAAVR